MIPTPLQNNLVVIEYCGHKTKNVLVILESYLDLKIYFDIIPAVYSLNEYWNLGVVEDGKKTDF